VRFNLNKELFRKTEGKLYSYFREKKEINDIRVRIEQLEKQIESIEYDIKNTNIRIDYYQPGMGINERVQTSTNSTSYAESEIMRAIGKLEEERAIKIRNLFKLKAKRRDTESFITHMEQNLKDLNPENKKFIELKYRDEIKVNIIAERLNIATATAYRMRDELVEDIAKHEGSFLY